MKRLLVLVLVLLSLGNAAEAKRRGMASQTDTLKILIIGNSFSEDSVDFLDELAASAGVPMIVAQLYKGGMSIEQHCDFVAGNKPVYSFRRRVMGNYSAVNDTTFMYGIANERWDCIFLHQQSARAGVKSSYFPYIVDLMGMVRNAVPNPEVPFGIFQTWAYADNVGGIRNEEFMKFYNHSQIDMYRSIVDAVNEIAAELDIDYIFPVGTAIQNARTALGDTLCRDGYHLDKGVGRYTAACCLFEVLSGRSVVGNKFIPKNVTPHQARVAQMAAHKAVRNPSKVTHIKVK